jgi:hypothetical protein
MITPYEVMYYGFDLNIIRSRLGEDRFKIFEKRYNQMMDEIEYDCLEITQEVYGKPGVTTH